VPPVAMRSTIAAPINPVPRNAVIAVVWAMVV